MLIFGIKPDLTFVAILPLALLALLAFTSALSIFLSAVNVYLRDTQHLTEVLLMAWFWGTSIVYTYGTIFLSGHAKAHPVLKWLQYVYLLNPITPIVMTFQRAIYGRDPLHLPEPWAKGANRRIPRPPHLERGHLRGHDRASCWSSASDCSSWP